MFYILKSAYLYHSRGFFFLIIIFLFAFHDRFRAFHDKCIAALTDRTVTLVTKKGWWRLSPLQPLLLCSKISLF